MGCSLPQRASVTAALLLLFPAPPVQPQVYREHVEVGLVRVELFVRGSDGLPILDLKPSEVRLTVDGRTVAVDGLALAPAPESQPVAQGPTPSSPPGPSPTAVVAPARETSTDLVAIFVDETTTEQFNRNAAYGQLRRFLEDLPRGASALLQRFDGALAVECPWTTDRQALLAALERMQSRSVVPRLPSRESEGFEPNAQLSEMEARAHIRSSLSALYEAVLRFPMTEGRRRSLVFVTDGGPFQGQLDIARDLGLAPEPASGILQGSREARGRELARERDAAGEGLARRRAWISQLADVTRLANRREIALIPVRSASPEVGGFRGAHQSGEGVGAPPGSPSSGLTREASFAAWLAVNHGMSEVSELTGGEAVLTRKAFAHRMRRFLDDRARAYVLTFRDPFPKDRRDHSISIELSRPRTTLRYRRSYRVGAPVESLTEDVITRLYDPAPRNPLGAAARIEGLRRERDVVVARLTIAYPVPPEAGSATAPAAPRDVGMIGVCAARDGSRSEPVRYEGKVKPVPARGGERVLFYFDVRIRPGTYFWSLAVTDGPTSITSYLSVESRLGEE